MRMKDGRLQEMEDVIRDRDDINISHISKISKKVDRDYFGQFYGGDKSKDEEDYGEILKLKQRIKELEDLLAKKDLLHQ